MSAPLGRDWLLANLPHQGSMSLLDGIVSWDAASVHATATGHRDPRHPLRSRGELPVASGIEYGAQAAAAHGALVRGAPSSQGFIASLRGVRFHARRLDDLAQRLDIVAEQLGESDAGVLYRFEVSSASRVLVEGRVAVAFTR